MKKKLSFHWMLIVVMSILTTGFVSCGPEEVVESPLINHWGCEKYISCRTNDDGSEKWDTLYYELGTGHGYELWFWNDGKGKLKLNDSPAFIKEFNCTYELDEAANQIVVHGSAWLYALYGTLYLDENEGRFDIETLNDSTLIACWTNHVSEPQPFFERFYLKVIQ